ncbi:MAG TPA: conjugative transposon protein TraN [Bacteroidetes bacterium]|nr:conjugative transposon protein TraN [Bacteroidota bacterium]
MRKLLFFLAVTLMAAGHSYAQKFPVTATKLLDLPVVYLPPNVTVHFISPEPIQYVDISTKQIIGDLPVKNILRIRHVLVDSLKVHAFGDTGADAVVTIVGEKFIAQYHVISSPNVVAGAIKTDIEIDLAEVRPLEVRGVSLSQPELHQYALRLLAQKPEKHLQHTSSFGIKANLNHVYTLGDYIFLDIGYENKTNLRYDIDELRFKIDDKKVTKASNVQSIEIKPEFTLFDTPFFKKHYRNVFVFKKFTFPGNKLLHIELSEKQLSGRIITLQVAYSDILEADTVPW